MAYTAAGCVNPGEMCILQQQSFPWSITSMQLQCQRLICASSNRLVMMPPMWLSLSLRYLLLRTSLHVSGWVCLCMLPCLLFQLLPKLPGTHTQFPRMWHFSSICTFGLIWNAGSAARSTGYSMLPATVSILRYFRWLQMLSVSCWYPGSYTTSVDTMRWIQIIFNASASVPRFLKCSDPICIALYLVDSLYGSWFCFCCRENGSESGKTFELSECRCTLQTCLVQEVWHSMTWLYLE